MNLYHHHWASGTDFHLVHLSTSQTVSTQWRSSLLKDQDLSSPLTVWGPAFTGITLPTIWYLWQAGKVNCYFQVCFLSPRKEKPPDTDLLSTTYLYFESCELWALGYTLGLEPPALHCTRVHISSPPHVVHSKISTCTVCKDLFLRLSHEHNPILILLGLWRNLKSDMWMERYLQIHLVDWNLSYHFLKMVSSVQFISVAQSCPTLCNPMDCSMVNQLLIYFCLCWVFDAARRVFAVRGLSLVAASGSYSSCSALFWREQRL